jgi:hypothetical protein
MIATTTTPNKLRVGSRRHWLYALVIATVATSATAAELPTAPDIWQPVFTPKLYPQWEINIGGRYFFSSGRTQTSLFGVVDAPPILVSRLTWTGLQAQAGEIFGRVDHLYSGFFIKGFAGGGAITRGNLQDEDFPTPFFFPYSSTNSEQRDGRLAYATLDFGWATNILDGVKVGFFAGYSYNYERVNAFGCVQTASNPFVCVPPFPSSVVCTENLIRIDCVTESPNVNGDDRALLPRPDPVRLTVQVKERT